MPITNAVIAVVNIPIPKSNSDKPAIFEAILVDCNRIIKFILFELEVKLPIPAFPRLSGATDFPGIFPQPGVKKTGPDI